MCQDENENQPGDERFCSFLTKPVTNEQGFKYYDRLKDLCVRNALLPEQTKAFGFSRGICFCPGT